jgi:hypothetical protein
MRIIKGKTESHGAVQMVCHTLYLYIMLTYAYMPSGRAQNLGRGLLLRQEIRGGAGERPSFFAAASLVFHTHLSTFVCNLNEERVSRKTKQNSQNWAP